MAMATPVEDRPPIDHDVRTADLPANPQREQMIPAGRWVEAPPEVRALGADLGYDLVSYIRRIGRFLVWRAGPATVSYTHLRAHETDSYLVCRLLLEKKKKKK